MYPHKKNANSIVIFIQKRPVAIGDNIEIKPMMYLALSYDHRIIDGREAVSFLVRIKEIIEDPRRLVVGA